MNFNIRALFVFVLISLPFISFGQKKINDVLPDFEYSDYSNQLKYMTQSHSLTNQTLYLPSETTDTLSQFFFVGSIANPEKGDKTGITYYQLKRMDKGMLDKMNGEWFVVAGYVADQVAYRKIYDAEYIKRDFRNLEYPFLKLVIAGGTDTVFYNYTGFWNRYNFPFIPMSYYNANKNQYKNNKWINNDVEIVNYDTNSNYAYLPKNLVGQRITLPVVTEETYKRLFNGTKLFNYSDDDRKYSYTDYPIGKAKQLAGKTFIVADWAHDAEGLTNVYLKLISPGARDTVYYKYPTIKERNLFPFVIESFCKRMREKYTHQEFIYRGTKYPLITLDNKRKTPVTMRQGDIFQCLDFVVKDGKFQMLMRNEKGRKFYVPADYTLGDKLSFDISLIEAKKAFKYKRTYPNAFKAILQKELIPGMSMDMVRMSWGEPERITETNFDGSNCQWFYLGNIYIIFKNNTLHRVAMIPKEMRN